MIKNLLDADEERSAETEAVREEEITPAPLTKPIAAAAPDAAADAAIAAPTEMQSAADAEATLVEAGETPVFQPAYTPETPTETIRKSGLAYAAAITLFASVVFMLILGWLADLLLGTAPWGIVGGIVLGAVIGFVQFFRITSQILKNKD